MSKSIQSEDVQALFEKVYGAAPTVITRAPGRIEFIGNHTDYNEGTVLGASIDRSVWVGLRLVEQPTMTFYSDLSKTKVTVPLDKPHKQEGDNSWVNYPLGCWVSMPVFNLKQTGGFEYLALSDLPTGAGLSSSAAIELATCLAYLDATNQTLDTQTLVKLARYAENNFAGVPCGFLDQTVSGFGKENHLVYIDCKGPKASTVALPKGVRFWIFNTHTKHALVDSFYSTRHKECMDAAEALGVKALVEVSTKEMDKLEKLPSAVKLRAKHVIEEIDRVEQVMTALSKSDLKQVGELLVASHRSSQTQFENSTPELDFLVDEIIKMPHVYGARLTGGGFGGAVLAVVSAEFSEKEADAVATNYEKKFGKKVEVLQTKTGPGAQVILSKSTPKKSQNNKTTMVILFGIVGISVGIMAARRFFKTRF